MKERPRPKQLRQSILPVPLQMVHGGSGRFGLSLLTFDCIMVTVKTSETGVQTSEKMAQNVCSFISPNVYLVWNAGVLSVWEGEDLLFPWGRHTREVQDNGIDKQSMGHLFGKNRKSCAPSAEAAIWYTGVSLKAKAQMLLQFRRLVWNSAKSWSITCVLEPIELNHGFEI